LGIGSVTPDALMKQIVDGTAPVIVDVRSTAEYRAGHVPGAIHLPFWQVGLSLSRRSVQREGGPKLAAARQASIVVYCGHGPRAYIAGAALRRRGFSNIAYLAGHMKKWKELNLPLEGK
jgi:rhodanese-related sulfurtransferase